MHTINDNQGHFKKLLLFPDYASSGLWCECGLGLGNPKEELNVPYQIIDLIDLWNSYWDLSSNNKSINKEYVEKEIINTGRILCEMLSEHIPCKFLEDRSRLDRR